ncbi:MAG TPA: hypothetical protein PK530_00240 [Anaerolineales bacterium]|nr:hypothetical protein [Anaerolineales bacterium]
MGNNGHLSPAQALGPRMVSIYELRAKLMPLMQGYAWAEDALMDLWKMGAPDPAPTSTPCALAFGPAACARQMNGQERCGKYGCAREKRVLLPSQFEKWWADCAQRQGVEFMATDLLKPPQGIHHKGRKGHEGGN